MSQSGNARGTSWYSYRLAALVVYTAIRAPSVALIAITTIRGEGEEDSPH